MDYLDKIKIDIERRENDINSIEYIMNNNKDEDEEEKKPKKLSEKQIFIGIKNKKKKK